MTNQHDGRLRLVDQIAPSRGVSIKIAQLCACLAAAERAWVLTTSHPYRDGNKRAAFLAMATFVEISGAAMLGNSFDTA